jgi:hypothetical protein
VSQAGVVTRLATSELWITFRMLAILVAFVGPGALTALLPAPPAVSLERLAIGLGAATVLSAALAAWSVADERVSGRTGWLVTRSVPRGTYVVGWFLALTTIALFGVAAAGFLGWLATGSGSFGAETAELAAAVAAVGTAVAAAHAIGIVAGLVARPVVASIVAALICIAVGAAAILAPEVAALLPHTVLAEVVAPSTDVSVALRSAGIGLSVSAVLLFAARLAIERADL